MQLTHHAICITLACTTLMLFATGYGRGHRQGEHTRERKRRHERARVRIVGVGANVGGSWAVHLNQYDECGIDAQHGR